MNKKELSSKTVADLKTIATEKGISGISKKTKTELVDLILARETTNVEAPSNKEQEAPKTSDFSVQTSTEPKQEETSNKSEATEVSSLKSENSQSAPPQPSNNLTSTQPQATSHVPQAPQNRHQQHNNQRNQQRHQNQNRNQHQNNQNRHNNNQNQRSQIQEDSMLQQDPSKFTDENTVEVTGILEIMSDGTHGVLRTPKLIATDKDTYISISQVKKFRLRKGDYVRGIARLPKENERYFSLLWIKDVNGVLVEKLQSRPNFDDLKPVYPDKQIKLEIDQYPIANRVIDLLAPIGFGQRSMIVAQPKSGKTYLLKDIAKGINENYPEVHLMVVLIGERPEEVTDIERSVKGTVYASNFDDSPQNQVAVAELSLERAKRMVELGQDVIILMDSLTRLARAYNVALPASGRTLSGGLDPVSLYPSKRFFGAARNFENGASLTIIATSLVDTGSKMDEVIFEEFKGTGNMELKLDRRLANKRVFPAIDLLASGTRNEELLLGSEQLQSSWKIRRLLENLGQDSDEALIDRMKGTKSNDEFLNTLHQY